MKNILRYSLLVVLATAMTIGPASAVHMMDRGCYSPEPVCCSECGCDGYATPCGSCCSGHAHVVSAAPGCCGEVVMQEAQPAEAEVHYPQPTQSEPDVAEDLAPPVTNTSNTHPEPEPEMPPVEETPVQPEFDPLDSPITSPAIDPSPVEDESFPVEVMEEFDAVPAEEMEEYDSGPAEEAEENDVEPAEEKDPLDDLFGEVRRPAALSVPGGLESGASRRWTDNTAKYHCEARLLGVAQGKIVLAKADGKISHVPLRRLSDRDLNFVYQQVVAKRELLARQAETEKIASVWSK